MSVEHDQIVRFKLNDGSVIDVDPILAEISGTIIDYLKTASGVEHEIPIQFEKITPETVEFMNKCIRWMKEKIPNELRGNSNEPNHWPDTFEDRRKDILKQLDKDTSDHILIQGANLGDFLIIPPFLELCTFLLAGRAKEKSILELREMLNEKKDFSDEQLRLMEQVESKADI